LAVISRRDKIELPTLRAVHSQMTGRLFLARTYATLGRLVESAK
jgi:hypothetical protein